MRSLITRLPLLNKLTGIHRVRRTDLLLVAIGAFHKEGKQEVSLSEVNECIGQWQQNVPLGYSFSEYFPYSYDLLEDLSRLEYEGYIDQYAYSHDHLLPKGFVRMTPAGLLLIDRIVPKLSPDELRTLRQAVSAGMQIYAQSWVLWARK